MGNYDDIINKNRPDNGRVKMPIADRAKIFMPFAALKGHDEAIYDTKEKNVELYKEDKEQFYESI